MMIYSSMGDKIASLFSNILLICHEEGLLGGTHFSLDGVKLSSNASKEWSGKHNELQQKQKKLEEKVKQVIKQHKEGDNLEEGGNSDKERRERRIERLKQRAKRIEEFLKENEPKIGSENREIKSNVTDPESAYMKTSHGMQQGYNAQALVDSKDQIIIDAEATSQPQDFSQIENVLPKAKETLKNAGLGEDYLEGKILTADSNYHSEQNLKVCEEEKIDAYIPDTQFRKRDMRFEERGKYKPKPKLDGKFSIEDFRHDPKNDSYICKNGKVLTLQSAGHRIGKNYTDKMREKIDTLRGRMVYEKRLSIVEPAFANIEYHKGMNRFTLRGRKKVDIQWRLYCIVHNIGKICSLSMAI